MTIRRQGDVGACLFAAGALLALAGAARADHWNSKTGSPVATTLAAIDHPDGGLYDTTWYRYDNTMRFYEPTCNAAPCAAGIVPKRDQLIVIFGGRPGPKPTAYDTFQQYAADIGFHSIAIDYDYEHEVGTDPPLDPGRICGCYTNCYTHLNQMVAQGINYSGIPVSRYPVLDRIARVASYLDGARPGNGWGQFVDAGDQPRFDKIVLVGLSRGVSLAATIAKQNRVRRLLLFSGMNDSLMDPAGSGTQTSFRYGLETGIGACTPTPAHAAPAYVVDNAWTTDGTIWATQRNQSDNEMYSYMSEANHPTWEKTLPSLQALGLDTVAGGAHHIGDYMNGEIAGWDTHDAHFLSPGGVGDLCGPSSSASVHINSLTGTCPGPGPGGNGEAIRRKLWSYMLTH